MNNIFLHNLQFLKSNNILYYRLTHSLKAPIGIKKDARDANLKETDQEWYSIDDPRNLINVKRREKNDELK